MSLMLSTVKCLEVMIENKKMKDLNGNMVLKIRKELCRMLFISDGCLNKLIINNCKKFGIYYTDIHLQLTELMKNINPFSAVAAELYNLRNIISHTKPLNSNYIIHLARSLIRYIYVVGLDVETYESVVFLKNVIALM